MRRLTGGAAALCFIMMGGCAPLTPERLATSLPAEYRPSPNFDERRPNFVILHHTSNENIEHSLRVLTGSTPRVSAHYLIGRNGRIYQLVDERHRAWHAGESFWGGQRDLNSTSIGIELDNNGDEPFAEPQIVSLIALLTDLKSRYKIPAANFLGHGDVAPGRKVDPSHLFPWRRLAEHGFGVWCEPPYPSVPADLDTATLLHAFGYNVWNLEAAMAAFKRRFAPEDPSPQMTERDRSVLYCLLLQSRTLAAQ
jgi:N-acetylmuramoyl-L-alanine amidase